MNLGRRPLPWWLPLIALILVATPVLVRVYLNREVPLALVLIAVGIVYVAAIDSTIAPGRRRLGREAAPAPVFATEYDGGTRDALRDLCGAALDESWSFLVPASEGLEIWSLERTPRRLGVIPWTVLQAAHATSTVGRWLTGTVEVALADGRALYLDVRVQLRDRLSGGGSSAAQLASSLNERITPARPDAARTPPPARTG